MLSAAAAGAAAKQLASASAASANFFIPRFIFTLPLSDYCPSGAGHLTIGQVSTTVFSAFEHAARAHPSKPFLHVLPERVELTYGEALAQVESIAARYRERGYARGHRIALKLPNCPQFLPHFLALNSLGA